VLDLHCDNEAVLHIYSGTPLAAAIAPLSALMQSHATLLTTESGGEPFDEACSRLWWELAQHFATRHPIPPACVAATIELRGERDVSEQLAEADADGILRYLALNGMLELEEPMKIRCHRRCARPRAGSGPAVAGAARRRAVVPQSAGRRVEAGE
jgi:predicted deacylase